MDDDLVAGLPARDALADLPDDARGVGAADVVAVLGVVAVAEDRDRLAERRPDVVEVHAGGHHAHDHLEGAGLGDLDLLELEGVLRLALALLRGSPRRPSSRAARPARRRAWTLSATSDGHGSVPLVGRLRPRSYRGGRVVGPGAARLGTGSLGRRPRRLRGLGARRRAGGSRSRSVGERSRRRPPRRAAESHMRGRQRVRRRRPCSARPTSLSGVGSSCFERRRRPPEPRLLDEPARCWRGVEAGAGERARAARCALRCWNSAPSSGDAEGAADHAAHREDPGGDAGLGRVRRRSSRRWTSATS